MRIKVYTLPKLSMRRQLDCNLSKIGAVLTKMTTQQADYIGVPIDGPFKSTEYRY